MKLGTCKMYLCVAMPNFVIISILKLTQVACSENNGKIKAIDVGSRLGEIVKTGNFNETTERRFQELNEKLVKTSEFALDRVDFAKLLLNETKKDNLNRTSLLEVLENDNITKPAAEYHNPDGRRLYKAEEGTIRDYPFVVSVHVMGRFQCGGALHRPDLVLTSSSCLQLLYNNRMFRENPRILSVRVGSNHSLVGGEIIDALEVYFHPAYNSKTLEFNIAVIRLQRHVFFDHKHMPKLIEISENPNPPPSNVVVLILGWGATKAYSATKYEPTYLQKQVLPIYPNHFCKDVYGEKFVRQSMFCAGTITTGEGACDNDGGGPAILGGRLVGIISFGPPVCGHPNSPTVFTNVGFFANWIDSIKKNIPGYHQQTVKTTRLPKTKDSEETTIATEESATLVVKDNEGS